MPPQTLEQLAPPPGRPFPIWILLLGLLLAACGQVEAPEEGAGTSVAAQLQEVIVTRVIRRTVEVPAIAEVELPPEPVVLDVSQIGTYDSLDPQLAADDNSVDLIENLFIGLTRFNHQTATLDPALAESWQVSGDGRTWTFILREDIYWVGAPTDGGFLPGSQPPAQAVRPVTSADVVAAAHRICDPRVATPDAFIFFIIEGCQAVQRLAEPAAEDLAQIGVRAVGDYTVSIRLTEPAGYFGTITSHWQFKPVPSGVVDEMGEAWTQRENLLTSGPFFIGPGTVGGRRTVLVRNPFWPIPFEGNVEMVNVNHLDETMEAYELWEQRQLDLSPVPVLELTDAQRRHRLKLATVPDQSVFYLAYNFESRAFSSPEVRRAFGWAIDRERLIEEVYGNQAVPVRHFAPAGTAGAPPADLVGMGYNPDRARQQMAASGFGDCRLLPPIRYLVSSSDRALQQAEVLRRMWSRELGCREEQFIIEQVQFGELLASTRPEAGRNRPDIWDLGWAPYFPDEHNWVHDVLHCVNSENRQLRPCSEVDELMVRAAHTAGAGEREALYRQVEQLFFGEDALEPVSPLFSRARPFVVQSWLSYTPALFGGEQYDTYTVVADVKALERLR
jgi:oligopeptide transport system substrate-binding protein